MDDAELAEVFEEAASGRVAGILGDVRQVLRVTQAAFFFRALAAHEAYLAAAWEALKPNASVAYFERCADSLRMRMTPPLPPDVPEHAEALEELGYPAERVAEVAGILEAYNYANPKNLILAAALKGALNGVRIGGVKPGHAGDLDPLPQGPPRSMRKAALVDPARAEGRVRALLEEIGRSSPGGAVGSVWRALAGHPEYLELAWAFVREESKKKGFEITVSLSQGAAAAAAQEFPHPVALDRARARALGLGEAEVDRIDRTLDRFIHLIPRTNVSILLLKAALLGEGRVRRKPFEGE
ncbi:MAG: hypothetical protein A3I72_12415 [Candidatus Tectomicrobia bacterium RIFCSPLOWO2_02_FULL_70_19]|nr:MAG: hypothetical protein A3I72_12415 [Candidatus Tectomicrobia bacterium RIFCSPLOWO2_02_FULL_70_19]